MHLVGFYYKNISRCTVLWMSNSLFVSNFPSLFIFISSLIYLTYWLLYILLLFTSPFVFSLCSFIFPVRGATAQPSWSAVTILSEQTVYTSAKAELREFRGFPVFLALWLLRGSPGWSKRFAVHRRSPQAPICSVVFQQENKWLTALVPIISINLNLSKQISFILHRSDIPFISLEHNFELCHVT